MKKALSLMICAVMVFAFMMPLFRDSIADAKQLDTKAVDGGNELTVQKVQDEALRDTVYMNSGLASIPKLSKQEIYQLLRNNPTTMPSNVFVTAPTYNPYTTGELTQEVLSRTLNRLNALRQLCGLTPVALDAALCQNAQYGAVLQACLPSLNHTPPASSKPEGMTDEFFNLGYNASSSSNLYAGRDLTRTPDGFMNDSDSGNIKRVGHRRWQLNPAMGKIGFGYAEKSDSNFRRYTCEKVFDSSVTPGEYDFISWPSSGNFPNNTDGFDSNTAWSVTFNLSKYTALNENDITVTITRDSDDTVWTLDSTCKDTGTRGKYLTVSTGGIGSGTCLIFRPDGITKYEGIYTVVINGVKDRSGNSVSCAFQVDFFNAAVDPNEPTPVPTPVPTPTPAPTPTPEPTDIPSDGELVTEKSIVLEADGTYTISFGAYSTGTLHDASSEMKFYFDGDVTLPSTVSLNVLKYKCLRYENGEPVFASYGSSIYNDVSIGVSYYAYSPNRLLMTVSGFDFYSNTVSYSGGYKIVVKVYGVSPRYANAVGTVQTNEVARTGIYLNSSAAAPDAVFPDENIMIGNRYVSYDFGKQLVFSEDGVSDVLSIDSAFPAYKSQNGAYAYNTSMPSGEDDAPGYSATISEKKLSFDPLSINTDLTTMNALIRLSGGSYEWTKLTFLPATAVLYEEGFGTYSNSESGGENGQWTVDGTPSDTPQTGGGVYGFDASYLGSTGDSNGSAMKVTVDRALMQAVSSGSTVWPSANFSFTGTGLDLISHIGEDSGVLTIDLVPEGSSWSYVGNNARHVTIDTYYTGGTLHQVPVFRIENLPYGSYSIRVIARYSPRFDHQSNEYVGIKGGSEINEPGLEPGVEYTVMNACENASEALPGRAYGSFTSFIDGIRVYNPLGTELPEAAAEAYAADGELAPEFCNVNGLLEGDDAIYVTIGDDSVEPADYVDVSPKNEVYIRPGGAIAFGIDGDYSAVHIGAKSPLGKSVSMKISGGEPIELTHTTELYYDITSLIEGNRVSIEVSGSDPDAILSLVCIKLIPSDAGGVSPRIVSDASLAEFVEAIHFGIVGDADRDGAVSITDALLVMRTLLEGSELGTYASFCADINRDGSIDMADALSILRLAMAII